MSTMYRENDLVVREYSGHIVTVISVNDNTVIHGGERLATWEHETFADRRKYLWYRYDTGRVAGDSPETVKPWTKCHDSTR